MKRFLLISFMSLVLVDSMIAQDKNQTKKQSLPKENSKVTREYDEKGNLIKFDSVYSYSWSSDSTLMNGLSEKDFPSFFGQGFGFQGDSTSQGGSFFEDFDKLFARPFGNSDLKQDSIFSRHFNEMKQFHQFNDNDSTTFGFGDLGNLFDHFFENKADSTSVKKHGNLAQESQPKSMDEIMQLFQQQFQEMEKQQKQFFEGNKKLKQF